MIINVARVWPGRRVKWLVLRHSTCSAAFKWLDQQHQSLPLSLTSHGDFRNIRYLLICWRMEMHALKIRPRRTRTQPLKAVGISKQAHSVLQISSLYILTVPEKTHHIPNLVQIYTLDWMSPAVQKRTCCESARSNFQNTQLNLQIPIEARRCLANIAFSRHTFRAVLWQKATWARLRWRCRSRKGKHTEWTCRPLRVDHSGGYSRDWNLERLDGEPNEWAFEP